jgi:hypothetical protein
MSSGWHASCKRVKTRSGQPDQGEEVRHADDFVRVGFGKQEL